MWHPGPPLGIEAHRFSTLDIRHVMAKSRPQNETQLSTNLPGVTHYITGHNDQGRAIVESSNPGHWTPLLGDSLAFNVIYTTSGFPVSLNDNKDIKTHEEVISSKKLGLVNANGTVCRMVDFAPDSKPLVHRTQSLDYGLVLEGEVEMILDDGVTKIMKRGDVAVQRATNHGVSYVSQPVLLKLRSPRVCLK